MMRKVLWSGPYAVAGMSALDTLADKAQRASERLAAQSQNGLKRKLAEELADDAAFLRKLKPKLIARRARPAPPSGPQLDERPQPTEARARGGPNPFLVVGVALVAGVALAKFIDWRGHAHPKR
jgi:hypothetical protein